MNRECAACECTRNAQLVFRFCIRNFRFLTKLLYATVAYALRSCVGFRSSSFSRRLRTASRGSGRHIVCATFRPGGGQGEPARRCQRAMPLAPKTISHLWRGTDVVYQISSVNGYPPCRKSGTRALLNIRRRRRSPVPTAVFRREGASRPARRSSSRFAARDARHSSHPMTSDLCMGQLLPQGTQLRENLKVTKIRQPLGLAPVKGGIIQCRAHHLTRRRSAFGVLLCMQIRSSARTASLSSAVMDGIIPNSPIRRDAESRLDVWGVWRGGRW